MEIEKNISGKSENLADSIAEQKAIKKGQKAKTLLQGKRIAISISESEELEQSDLSDSHLKDISIKIARYLIVNGATLLYGGDLRNGGFTKLCSKISFQNKYLSNNQSRFINYFPFPNSKSVSLNDEAICVKEQMDTIILEPPKHLGNIDTERKYAPSENLDDKFVFSECFADMRIVIANKSDSRVLLGGKQKNFLGYIPGIIEEAYQSLKANKAIFLLGGFGGATKSLIRVITGDRPRELTNEFQFDNIFLNEFRNFCLGKSVINLDYVYLVDFFQHHNIELISKQNGLSIEENKILFESTDIYELVFLIIKGMLNISR